MDKEGPKPAENTAAAGPFKALIAGWSLAVVVLAVAGFSLRWTYYYNFGLYSLVLDAPLERLPVYAIEILRSRESILDLVWLAIKWLLPFHLILMALLWARRSPVRGLRAASQVAIRFTGLDSPLVVDAIGAAIIIAIAFTAGGNAGYRTYNANVVEATSRLPRVTLIGLSDDAAAQLPMTCDKTPLKERAPAATPHFIGDSDIVNLMAASAGCSSEKQRWRLLLQDEKHIYLFATVPDPGRRPMTLVLSADEKLAIVLQ